MHCNVQLILLVGHLCTEKPHLRIVVCVYRDIYLIYSLANSFLRGKIQALFQAGMQLIENT